MNPETHAGKFGQSCGFYCIDDAEVCLVMKASKLHVLPGLVGSAQIVVVGL